MRPRLREPERTDETLRDAMTCSERRLSGSSQIGGEHRGDTANSGVPPERETNATSHVCQATRGATCSGEYAELSSRPPRAHAGPLSGSLLQVRSYRRPGHPDRVSVVAEGELLVTLLLAFPDATLGVALSIATLPVAFAGVTRLSRGHIGAHSAVSGQSRSTYEPVQRLPARTRLDQQARERPESGSFHPSPPGVLGGVTSRLKLTPVRFCASSRPSGAWLRRGRARSGRR